MQFELLHEECKDAFLSDKDSAICNDCWQILVEEDEKLCKERGCISHNVN